MAKHDKPEQQRHMENDDSLPPSYPPRYRPPRRPFVEPPTEPMRVRSVPPPPDDQPTMVAGPLLHPPELHEPTVLQAPPAPGRGRSEPPVPIVSDEPPLFRRTGVLVALAAGVAALLGVGIGIAGVTLGHTDHNSTQAAPIAPAPTTTTNPPDAVSPTGSAPETSSFTDTDTTTETTTTTTTITTTTTPTSSTTFVPASGRFSGTIATQSGNIWTVNGWDGTVTKIRITGSTKMVPTASIFGGTGFTPGETVNIFWHTDGSGLVADSVYGLS